MAFVFLKLWMKLMANDAPPEIGHPRAPPVLAASRAPVPTEVLLDSVRQARDGAEDVLRMLPARCRVAPIEVSM